MLSSEGFMRRGSATMSMCIWSSPINIYSGLMYRNRGFRPPKDEGREVLLNEEQGGI